MKIVWKPLEDIKLSLFGRKQKLLSNISFVKVRQPIFLTNTGVAAAAKTVKFKDSEELLENLNSSFISTVYYLKHEHRNYIDDSGVTQTCLILRYYAE